MRHRSIFLTLVSTFALVLVGLTPLVVTLTSANKLPFGKLDFGFLHGYIFWKSLADTLRISTVTAILNDVFSLLLGLCVFKLGSGAEKLVVSLTFLSLTCLTISRAEGFLLLSGFGLPWLSTTETAVVLALLNLSLPLGTYICSRNLSRQVRKRFLAACLMTANKWTRFRIGILPSAGRALVAIFALTFLFSVGAFVTPSLLGGSGARLISVVIAEQGQNLQSVSLALTYSIALCLMMIILCLPVIATIAVVDLRRNWSDEQV